MQDIRFAFRMLRRNPGFTMIAVLTLGLGIGLNTALFSVIHAALVRPLAYPDAERLVWLTDYDYKFEHRDNYVSRPAFLQWKREATSFEAMTGYANQDLALMVGGASSQERIVSAAGEIWKVTGARVQRGRLFAANEVDVMVLSHALYQRRFGGDPGVIGRTVTINGHVYTVVGVLAPDFRFGFPQQFVPGDEVRDIDAYIPIPDFVLNLPELSIGPWDAAVRNAGPVPYNVRVVGKVREGVPMERARVEMETVYVRAMEKYPEHRRHHVRLHFDPLKEKLVGEARQALMVLLAGVGFVLLIACANIANLLLSRAAGRQREMAIRAALGAGRGRVIRQILTENLLLACLGGALGAVLAQWGIAAILRVAPHSVPRLAEAAINVQVLTYTMVISLLTGIVFGIGPAFAAWRTDLRCGLALDSGRSRIRNILVAGQLALAIVLLSGAGLMMKSFWRMNSHAPGFAPEQIVVMRVPLSGPAFATWLAKGAYLQQVKERTAAIPGVQAMGVDCGSLNGTVKVGGESRFAAIRAVSPGYLRAMGVPLLAGNWPADGDLFGVLVNESFARGMKTRGSMVGRRVEGSILNDSVTGVVADFKYRKLDAAPMPEVYMPYERFPFVRSAQVVTRVAGDPMAAIPAIRKAISGIDATQPVYEVQTLEQALSDSIAPRRFNLLLLVVFAGTALLMALVGIYGVISYVVAQRNREIGIRIALGATRGRVVGMVLGQGMKVAMVGIGLGVISAVGLSRLMANLLYEVPASDPVAFAGAAALLAGAAFVASLIPALKAALVDPLVALRYE
ncbi:MAG: ABC transporter permease [Acidobacteriota bacterium]